MDCNDSLGSSVGRCKHFEFGANFPSRQYNEMKSYSVYHKVINQAKLLFRIFEFVVFPPRKKNTKLATIFTDVINHLRENFMRKSLNFIKTCRREKKGRLASVVEFDVNCDEENNHRIHVVQII